MGKKGGEAVILSASTSDLLWWDGDERSPHDSSPTIWAHSSYASSQGFLLVRH